MELQPILSQVGSNAMKNLRETILENELLNKEANRVRIIGIIFFNSQERRLPT